MIESDGKRSEGAGRCHLCLQQSLIEIVQYRHLRRVTSDCRPWPAGGGLFICEHCATVQKVVDETFDRDAREIYAHYAVYHQGQGAEQAVFEQSSGTASSRSRRLIDALRAHFVLPQRGRMLDIGCGNGAMLRTFREAAPEWALAGTELNDKHRSEIEAIPSTEPLYTCPPERILGHFNLISMIHVLEHIPAPGDFLASLRSKLAPAAGHLLIEVPHYLQNPFELLIADHCTHFTAASARSLLQRAGYALVHYAEDWIPKELTIVAHVDAEGQAAPLARDIDPSLARRSVEDSLHWLGDVIDSARGLMKEGPIGLFGTSIAATWLFAELDGAPAFFVDEDPSRAGRTFEDRPIYHPCQAPAGARVFVGLPAKLAADICRRLNGNQARYYRPPAA